MDPRKISTLSLAALRRLAAERGIPGRSRMDRAALVAALAATPAAKAKKPAVKVRKTATADGAKAPKAAPATPAPVQDGPAPRVPREVEVRAMGAPRREPPGGEVPYDHGAVLPDRYPGTRVRVMVRDPETLFVYWEVPPEAGGEAWEIASLDADDRTLQAFRVGHEGTSGYLNVAATSVERVTLRPVLRGLPAEPWATVDLAAALPLPPLVTGPAPWVEIPAAFPDRDLPARGARTPGGARRARPAPAAEPSADLARALSGGPPAASSGSVPRRRT